MSPKQRKINAKAAKRHVLAYLKEREKTMGGHMGIVGIHPVSKNEMITHWIITVRFGSDDFRKFKVSRTTGLVYPQ